MSDLTILPVFEHESESAAPKAQDRVWRPQVNATEFILRYGDAIADMANHAGATVTSIVRWALLTVGCIGLLIADAAIRIDTFIERERKAMGVTRG